MLILASASPRRLELLKQVGIMPDEVVPAEIDEMPHKAELPKDYVARMAIEKFLSVFKSRHPSESWDPLSLDSCLRRNDEIILAADTVVACGRRILGKPENEAQAREFLQLLSGRRHRVYTSVCVNGRVKTVMTQVKFKRLTSADIDGYISSQEWQGKAGGYAIQGRGAAFVPWINGSYSNVVGLPLTETLSLLTSS